MYRKMSLDKGDSLGGVDFHFELAIFSVGLTYKHPLPLPPPSPPLHTLTLSCSPRRL